MNLFGEILTLVLVFGLAAIGLAAIGIILALMVDDYRGPWEPDEAADVVDDESDTAYD